MAVTGQKIEAFALEDIEQPFRLTTVPDAGIAAWTIAFTLRNRRGVSLVTKTTVAGVTIDDADEGTFTVALDSDDLDLDDASYPWEVCRTDAGSRTVLAQGELILRASLTV